MGMPEWGMDPRPVPRSQGGGMQVFSETVALRSTEATQFLDLTETLRSFLARSGIRHGLINVQTRHTTTGLLVNESEPLLAEDFAALFERWAPRHAAYRHDDLGEREEVPPDEPANGHAHARAMLLGTSVSLNVVEGRLQLGTWQRVFLVELDGSRSRSISVLALGLGDDDTHSTAEEIPTAGRRKMNGTGGRIARWLLAGMLPLLCLFAVTCRSTPPAPPDIATLRWTTYSNPALGYSLEVPDVYEASTYHDGADVRFRYDRFAVLVVDHMSEEEGRGRGLWPGHSPVGTIEIAGRVGSRYSYNHHDGPFYVHTVSYVVPHRGKFLGLEFRTESEEPDAIQRRILDSVRLE